MKIIPNWKEKKLRCHFCGETRSVKYTVYLEEYEFHDDVPCCNKCALLFSATQPRKAVRRDGERKAD